MRPLSLREIRTPEGEVLATDLTPEEAQNYFEAQQESRNFVLRTYHDRPVQVKLQSKVAIDFGTKK